MRKLAAAAFSFSAAIFFSRYLLPYEWLPFCCAFAAAASFAGLLFRGTKRLRVFIALLSLAVGFIWSWAYTSVFIKPSWYLHEETASVTAVVTDYPVTRARGYRVDTNIKRDGRSSVGARLYYFGETSLEPGDIVEFTARFKRTDGVREGERFDPLSSRGAFLAAYVSGDIKITGSEGRLRYFPQRLAAKVADMIDNIFPDDVSSFMQALVIGRREALDRDTALSSSLSASGIIHIIAISGMHVSFLMGFLGMAVRNKRLFSFISIPVLFLFMSMTGFSASVTRAGIMQIFLVCAPVFKRENDSITSLSAALFVLLAVNPYSCASAGLQLSFAATLGIMLFTHRINSGVSDIFRGKRFYRNRLTRAFISFIVTSLATTVGALIFTIPLTVAHFGYVSLIAPVTNLLTLWAVSLAFPFGLAASMLGFIFEPLGFAIAFPIAYLVRYIIIVARAMASIPYSIIYSSNAHILFWLIYIYAMFITLPLMRARARQYLYPACLAAILLCAVIIVSPYFPTAGNSSITVLDVGQGQSVSINSGRHTAIVDCGSASGENAGAIAHEFLLNQGVASIDLLILTHFHADHINGVEFLLGRVAVSALAIPDPDGSFLAEEIIELARRRGTDIIYVTEPLRVELGDMPIMLYPPLGAGDENEKGLSILTLGGLYSLITGDMTASGERALLRFAVIPHIDLLVVGHHGSRYSTSEELLAAANPNIAAISVGHNNYGHPSADTIELLESFDAAVYRTDLMGSITVTGK